MSLTVGRRQFLEQLGRSGAALAAGSWLASVGYVAAAGPARAIVNQARVRSELDRRLFGSFLEHLGRAVYTGVYDPGSPLADAKGFRRDVAEQIKGLGVPIMRYPGGNFVSGYNWLDGVGPKAARPTVIERAWNSLETNQFGTNEFIEWCRMVGTEPLLAFNLGTGTPETAVAYVEYCNVEKGTKWSELRRSHGYEQPHGVRTWCLGNEMDGPWQMGTMPARDYGRKARDTARQMRVLDRSYRAHRLRIEQHHPADVSGVGSRGAGGVLRPGRRDLAAQLLRQHPGAHRQQHRPLPGDEPRHGAPDPRDRRRLRLRPGHPQVTQAALAVVRRVERLVPRARRRLRRRQADRGAEAARGGLQPRGRAAGGRIPELAAAADPIASASAAWRRSST